MAGAHDIRGQILAVLRKTRTVDCHSHTWLRREYYAQGGYDLFSLTSYFDRDILATVGEEAFKNYKAAGNELEKWRQLKAVLRRARNVSYWRHNLVTYRGLFGLKDAELNDANWRRVNAAIRRQSKDPAWYEQVIVEKCKLETQVRNVPWFESWEPEYFTAVLRMEQALHMHEAGARAALERHLRVSIHSLPALKDALARLTRDYVSRGAVGIKLAHAYERTLHSLPVAEPRAARLFARALTGRKLAAPEVKELQDHIIFFLADLAREMKLVFQIHTGVQGNWCHIPDSDPLLLIPLLKDFREVRFDLFHTGYPYARELGMLGKHFPNVWLNMAWAYVISLAASRQILAEWLDLVPGYRLLGFGSDVIFPEMIYGHLEMARACVADVLAAKVKNDFLSREEALCLARKMFRDNALELYGLNAKTG